MQAFSFKTNLIRKFLPLKALFFVILLASCQQNQCPEPVIPDHTPTTILDIVPDTPMPTATVEPTATSTPIPPSTITSDTLAADWLPYQLPYQIYIPEGYQANGDTCYPLLILLHGQSYDETQWTELGIQKLADQVIDETGKPFLIVMPRESYYLQEMEESLYEQAIIELLYPEIMETYPVCSARTQHAVGGISRGASWAVWLGFDYPDDFAIVGAHSLPPHRNDIYQIPYWIKAMPKDDPLALYMDIGAYDRYLEAAQIFQNALVKYHVEHEFHLNDGMHEDAYWQEHLVDYLRWYDSQFHEPISSD
jgi:enterochelin esterase-like enzyme